LPSKIWTSLRQRAEPARVSFEIGDGSADVLAERRRQDTMLRCSPAAATSGHHAGRHDITLPSSGAAEGIGYVPQGARFSLTSRSARI